MPRENPDRHRNFLYGNQGQRTRRASFWACKRAESTPVNSPSTQTNQDSPSWNTLPDAGADMPQRDPTPFPGDCRTHHRAPGEHGHTYRNTIRVRQSEPLRPDQQLGFPPYQPPPFTMHPFNRLATTVKQCPWMLGSDVNPFAQGHNPDFYPPVPRSLKHDSAVSFVVTDQTRPEQPQFVISCPLEHVDSVRDMLAPAGSQRTLSARGSSGRPRDGAELRSMLLDGTPNIELSLHGSVANDANEIRGGGDGSRSGGGSGSSPSSRRTSFVRERPCRSSSIDDYSLPRGRHPGGEAPAFPVHFAAPGYYTGPAGDGPPQWK